MNLGFSKEINGWKTLFPEKIIKCLIKQDKEAELAKEFGKTCKALGYASFERYLSTLEKVNPKRHTIRVDESRRWEKGKKISFLD